MAPVLLSLVVAAVHPAATASAQQPAEKTPFYVGLSGSGVAIEMRRTALVDGTRSVITGRWTGVLVELRLGGLVLEGLGARGILNAAENTLPLAHEAGEMRARGRMELAPAFWLEGGVTYRTFDSPAGYQRWRSLAVGLALAPELGHSSLRAILRGHYVPRAVIEGVDTTNTAFIAEVGLTARPRRVPFILAVVYHVERYDFPDRSTLLGRRELVDVLQVSAGLRLGH